MDLEPAIVHKFEVTSPPRQPRRLRRFIPWLLTLLVVGYVIWSTDLVQAWDAVKHADLAAFLFYAAVITGCIFLGDCVCHVVLFRRLLGPVPARDIVAIKGASYFVSTIDYGGASAAIAYLLKRKRGIPFLSGLSAMLWLHFIDIIALCLWMTVGAMIAGEKLNPLVASSLATGLMIAWAVVAFVFVYWFLRVDFLVLGAARRWRVFDAFKRAKASDYVVMIGLRFAFIAVYIAYPLLTLPTFDIPIGVRELAVYEPLLTLTHIFPGSISGLGTVQLVMLALYEPHVTADVVGYTARNAQVVAYSALAGPVGTLIQLLIGFLFVSNVSKDFLPGKRKIEAPEPRTPEE